MIRDNSSFKAINKLANFIDFYAIFLNKVHFKTKIVVYGSYTYTFPVRQSISNADKCMKFWYIEDNNSQLRIQRAICTSIYLTRSKFIQS